MDNFLNRLYRNPYAPLDAASITRVDDAGNGYDDWNNMIAPATAPHKQTWGEIGQNALMSPVRIGASLLDSINPYQANEHPITDPNASTWRVPPLAQEAYSAATFPTRALNEGVTEDDINRSGQFVAGAMMGGGGLGAGLERSLAGNGISLGDRVMAKYLDWKHPDTWQTPTPDVPSSKLAWRYGADLNTNDVLQRYSPMETRAGNMFGEPDLSKLNRYQTELLNKLTSDDARYADLNRRPMEAYGVGYEGLTPTQTRHIRDGIEPPKQKPSFSVIDGGLAANADGRPGVMQALSSAYAPDNSLYMFGGRNAKTADLAKLSLAEELAAKGADRNAIWNETGWFQGPDKKWRFEIDDSKAKFRPRGAPTAEPNAYVDSYNDWDLVHRGAMAPWGVYEKDGQTSAGFAWPSMITEPIEAGKRFFSPGGGFENLPNEQSTQDATTLLLSMYGGNALNPATALPKNALGMFAGRKAATADHQALALAERLAAEGADRNAIWDQTGWFQGPDSKWRFEIDDSKAKFAAPGSTFADVYASAQGFKGMGDVLDHSGLFQAYPGLGDMGVGLSSKDGPLGSFGGRGANDIEVRGSSLSGEALETMLHEGQHAIQATESFAQGGNSEIMAPAMNSRKAWEARLPSAIRAELDDFGVGKIYASDDRWPTIKEGLRQRIEDDIGKPFRFRTLFDGIDEADLALEEARLYPAETLNAISLRRLKDLGLDGYERLAGEVEARNVQSRMNMSAEERRATPPWETQDIPDADQIVRLYSNASKEASLPALANALSDEGKGIIAYHGSPHDFDRFDMSKIGTGEGAQAYGHGLYFAENEGVANSYRDGLAGGSVKVKDGSPTGYPAIDFELEKRFDGNWDAFKKYHGGPNASPELQQAIDDIDRRGGIDYKSSGHMYQVRINANPEDFLDWDKPLSQQSEKVRNLAEKMGIPLDKPSRDWTQNGTTWNLGTMDDYPLPFGSVKHRPAYNDYDTNYYSRGVGGGTYFKNVEDAKKWVEDQTALLPDNRKGSDLYNSLSADSVEASRLLKEAGVPGISYYDQLSRSRPELDQLINGTRNHVILDDNLIEILKKYGWLAPGANLGNNSLSPQERE